MAYQKLINIYVCFGAKSAIQVQINSFIALKSNFMDRVFWLYCSRLENAKGSEQIEKCSVGARRFRRVYFSPQPAQTQRPTEL
ncbi:hypothetical protein J6590_032406 [Homalodisca vitripennis]|nr:hypothetical protein J6590_032406 [Homalodisca vitripennis]